MKILSPDEPVRIGSQAGVAVDRLVVGPSHQRAHAAEVTSGAATGGPAAPVRYVSTTATSRGMAVVQHWAGHGCSPGDAACDGHDGATGTHDAPTAGDHTAGHDAGEHAGVTQGATSHDATSHNATEASGGTSGAGTPGSSNDAETGGSRGQTDDHSSSGTTSGGTGENHESSGGD